MILARIEDVLAAITARVFQDASLARAMAVGCSGGLDSSVLLHAAHAHAIKHGIRLHAFHVHHGLADQADAWQAHVAQQAASLGVASDARKIDVVQNGSGIEGAARTGRYAALGAMCIAHDVPLLLTAHHQDDQAETVLLQLLRGSGVAGLSGMDACNAAPSLLGDPSLLMARPLLNLSRAALEQGAGRLGITYVDDPSNNDPRFARNALRHQVMPVLEASFPGFKERFARSARHAQAAQSLLITLAQEDFARCSDDGALLVDRLQALDDARIDNLLRYWFGLRGMRMPSTAWLQQLRGQIFGAKPDAQILVVHADGEIHRHRNRIVMTTRAAAPDPHQPAQTFQWDGNSVMACPAFSGRLHFDAAGEGVAGIDAAWLREQVLAVQWRSAGFTLKLAPNRPTRSLKYHYQAADIPVWERARLPLITIGAPGEGAAGMDADDSALLALGIGAAESSTIDRPHGARPTLLYAAGLGMDCHACSSGTAPRIVLRWQADADQDA